MIETEPVIEPVITTIELVGFGVIVVGMLGATLSVLYESIAGETPWEEAYFRLRRRNGRSLILGLELLVAAEIIRSITAETLQAVLLLAAIVLIRTFLAITLEMETEGHWPWQRHDRRGSSSNSEERSH